MMEPAKLIGSITVCLAVGIFGSLATSSSLAGWYPTLTKPSFTPPSWLFGPVWTLLYILMGISLYLVISSGRPGLTVPLSVFGIQLGLNLLWSLLFFGLQSPSIAAIEIVLLLFSVIITIFLFFPLSPAAAYLLVPYALWVAFASVLNISIWFLNR